MKNNFFRRGSAAAVFVTMLLMIALFAGGCLYLIEKDLIEFKFDIPFLPNGGHSEEVNENDNPENTENTQIVVENNDYQSGDFSYYEGIVNSTKLNDLMSKVVLFNDNHEPGISIYISPDAKTEEDAAQYFATTLVISKEGIMDQTEYYAAKSANTTYKVFVENGEDGIAKTIYVVKIGETAAVAPVSE